jgi:hypothetical protein
MHLDLGASSSIDTTPGALLGSNACARAPGSAPDVRSLGEVLPSVAAGGRALAAPLPGLVDRVTSRTTSNDSLRKALKSLNREKRIKRMRRVVSRHADSARDFFAVEGFRTRPIFLTLTYRDDVEWCPKQISAFTAIVRAHLGRRSAKCALEWVMELTLRGRPHYHLLLWVPPGVTLPKPDEAGWWPHGFTRIEAARSGPAYLVKYASKGYDDKPMPHRARIYGVGGSLEELRLVAHRAGLPAWLLPKIGAGNRGARVAWMGWCCRETGELFESPYIFKYGWDATGKAYFEFTKREILDASQSRMADVV